MTGSLTSRGGAVVERGESQATVTNANTQIVAPGEGNPNGVTVHTACVRGPGIGIVIGNGAYYLAILQNATMPRPLFLPPGVSLYGYAEASTTITITYEVH